MLLSCFKMQQRPQHITGFTKWCNAFFTLLFSNSQLYTKINLEKYWVDGATYKK